ncbi:formylglycine-generating enzyme family protein [Lacipirellula limnantheis]|uniref:Formylglycine-generating sulfatase enzyme n=1 Tax=Lacipirellula limnantheis TaxID=2528024 RepID=A0A517TYF1_9BACT|nr:SUMF1/EgtB/PvdO family nonheme iron enzyme [Lacipirellula limnantheis]QDT73396.1 Formylglycine-generating sulfatase enzyme [Lacipirellula limnantheis]
MKSSVPFILLTLTLCAFLMGAPAAQADSFGIGVNAFSIEFVPIGNLNNPDDATGSPNPVGKVEYAYRMGKYEISREMIAKANAEGGLGITMDSISFVNGGPRDDMPASGVTWFEAAIFVNWLNDQKGASPAYKFNGSTFELWQSGDPGYNPNNLFRNSQAHYFLPSVDEWYKAAYFDPSGGVYYDYPTGSNSAPATVANGTASGTAVYRQDFAQGPADITLAGGLSPYGTMGQGGNVEEWEETEFDLVNNTSSSGHGVRGGNWDGVSDLLLSLRRGGSSDLSSEFVFLGFRVASIPEPSAGLLQVFGMVGLMQRRRMRTRDPHSLLPFIV